MDQEIFVAQLRPGIEMSVNNNIYRVAATTYSGGSQSGLLIMTLLDITHLDNTGEEQTITMSVPFRPLI